MKDAEVEKDVVIMPEQKNNGVMLTAIDHHDALITQDIKLLSSLYNISLSVQIQKYSDKSMIGDCKALNRWLHEQNHIYALKTRLGKLNLKVWRCRIGRSGWHHGWTMSEAIFAAIKELEAQKDG